MRGAGARHVRAQRRDLRSPTSSAALVAQVRRRLGRKLNIDVDVLPRRLLKRAAGLRARRRGGRSRCCSGMQRTGRASGGGGPAAGRRRTGGAAFGGSRLDWCGGRTIPRENVGNVRMADFAGVRSAVVCRTESHKYSFWLT